jgi:bifunctional UDP-N-acetylglucosamine pyrophosphorylase/glucosamine-1-phosphate N-acetyltransferase
MVARVADAMRGAGITRIIAIVGHRAEDVRAALGGGAEFVVQEEQLGTGHAARCAQAALAEHVGPVVIAYADIPLITEDDIARLLEHHVLSRSAATMLTAILPEPGTLGRVVRATDGTVAGIIETRDATEEQLKIQEINVGVYCFQAPLVFEVLGSLRRDNAQSQYYLTDAVGLLVERGERVDAIPLQLPHNGMGVNTVEDLARAQELSTGG